MKANIGDKDKELSFYREIEDRRFEALINSYIYNLTTEKITKCKLEIMVKKAKKLAKQLKNPKTNFF